MHTAEGIKKEVTPLRSLLAYFRDIKFLQELPTEFLNDIFIKKVGLFDFGFPPDFLKNGDLPVCILLPGIKEKLLFIAIREYKDLYNKVTLDVKVIDSMMQTMRCTVDDIQNKKARPWNQLATALEDISEGNIFYNSDIDTLKYSLLDAFVLREFHKSFQKIFSSETQRGSIQAFVLARLSRRIMNDKALSDAIKDVRSLLSIRQVVTGFCVLFACDVDAPHIKLLTAATPHWDARLSNYCKGIGKKKRALTNHASASFPPLKRSKGSDQGQGNKIEDGIRHTDDQSEQADKLPLPPSTEQTKPVQHHPAVVSVIPTNNDDMLRGSLHSWVSDPTTTTVTLDDIALNFDSNWDTFVDHLLTTDDVTDDNAKVLDMLITVNAHKNDTPRSNPL